MLKKEAACTNFHATSRPVRKERERMRPSGVEPLCLSLAAPSFSIIVVRLINAHLRPVLGGFKPRAADSPFHRARYIGARTYESCGDVLRRRCRRCP